jgi:hypothetical protein
MLTGCVFRLLYKPLVCLSGEGDLCQPIHWQAILSLATSGAKLWCLAEQMIPGGQLVEGGTQGVY